MPTVTNEYKLRDANASDAAAILEIYSPFITHSATSFEYDVPSEDEIKRRIQNVTSNLPWLICEAKDGSIAGYSYASRYHSREGYQWNVEAAIYLSSEYQGKGVGNLLYTKLFEILKAQGYLQVLALIVGDNMQSIKFHERFGFRLVGKWENCGYKFGKWRDVSYYVKVLEELTDNPEKALKYCEIKNQINLNSF